MILETLIDRAEQLLRPFGSRNDYGDLWSDKELTEICLFQGKTFIVTPWVQTLQQGLESAGITEMPDSSKILEAMVPVPYIPLSSLGWEPGQKYSILNSDFELLYTVTPKALSFILNKAIEGKHYCWGLDLNDVSLLLKGRHGEVFYLLLDNGESNSLVQMILCQKLPIADEQKLLANWVELNRSKTVALGGLHLELLNDTNSNLWVYVNKESNITVGEDIIYSPNTEDYYFGKEEKSINLTLKGRGWLAFGNYSPAKVVTHEATALEFYNFLLNNNYKKQDQHSAPEIWYNGKYEISFNTVDNKVYEYSITKVNSFKIELNSSSLSDFNEFTIDDLVYYQWEGEGVIQGDLKLIERTEEENKWVEDYSKPIQGQNLDF